MTLSITTNEAQVAEMRIWWSSLNIYFCYLMIYGILLIHINKGFVYMIRVYDSASFSPPTPYITVKSVEDGVNPQSINIGIIGIVELRTSKRVPIDNNSTVNIYIYVNNMNVNNNYVFFVFLLCDALKAPQCSGETVGFCKHN